MGTNTNSEAGNRLLEFGIKPSLHRIAVLGYLMENMTHPTADVIFNELYPSIPTLSKTTVYNTLKLLEESGAIRTISIEERKLRYDADISYHAHFICKRCGCIHDLSLKEGDTFDVENFEDFILTEFHVYYKGYCKQCKDMFVHSAN